MAKRKPSRGKVRGRTRRRRSLWFRAVAGLFRGGWAATKWGGRGARGIWRYCSDEERLARNGARIRKRTQAHISKHLSNKWLKDQSGWQCMGCGQSGDFALAKGHVCRRLDPTAGNPSPAYSGNKKPPAPPARPHPSRRLDPAATISAPAYSGDKKPPARPRPSRTSGSGTSSKGARIVRANTAAGRFAYLAGAVPETSGQFETMCADLVQGLMMLAAEINGVAEDVDIDPRVKASLGRLADAVADCTEPARDVRRTFRLLYGPYLDAAATGVYVPRNPTFFQDAS